MPKLLKLSKSLKSLYDIADNPFYVEFILIVTRVKDTVTLKLILFGIEKQTQILKRINNMRYTE
ncbi:hypothetical protein CAL7716_048340 [Calothrix sp. PCC 7716]|nr:hypothetical protein CAL7716_048340 [Calothrix sp. PCC 7716]